ncbi:hypothetical protein CANCADRAFT_29674 [Tortispora caseinolytica NRRL Y-17796]|uniref:Vps41 beta-propeller domain-containing protein n=1 Tax=Tortispora caseinolytica NRRL Y-17796 TaxID=767744 RepID=A0A1E4T9F1_9ASCO|nr:hypothetical protein CANCADRAFT_29674 [Tortispora caseinolytica NRRL Y-17796]
MDSDTSSSISEEDEPRLQYSRITELPPSLFGSDPLATVASHSATLAFASHGGTVYLTDSQLKLTRSYRAHTASVLALSFSGDGTHIGSASLDGRVIISSVADDSDTSGSDFSRPIHALALDPAYQSTRSFISGGSAGKLVLSERGWFGNRIDTILYEGDSTITALSWRSELVIWTCEPGIHVMHVPTRKYICKIAWPKADLANGESYISPELYKPRIFWPSSDHIIIGWGPNIWVLRIEGTEPKPVVDNTSIYQKLPGFQGSVKSRSIRPAIVLATLELSDGIVSGVLPFGPDLLIALVYVTENGRPVLPELRIISPYTGEETSVDQISCRGYENLGANDYHLAQWKNPEDENDISFLMLSARDSIRAKERSLHDRYEWFLERKRFEEAWAIGSEILTDNELIAFLRQWVNSLIDSEPAMAAVVVRRVLTHLVPDLVVEQSTVGTNADDDDAIVSEKVNTVRNEWKSMVKLFTNKKIPCSIIHLVPVHEPLLDSEVYTALLQDSITQFMSSKDEEDWNRIVQALHVWPTSSYKVKDVSTSLENVLSAKDDLLSEDNTTHLQRILVDLYLDIGSPSSALPHLLELKDESAVEIISSNHLLSSLGNHIPSVFSIALTEDEKQCLSTSHTITDNERADIIEKVSSLIHLFAAGITELPMKNVIRSLKESSFHFLLYLYMIEVEKLNAEAINQHSNDFIEILSVYDRPRLSAFLSNPESTYSIEKALEICEAKGFDNELIEILGRTGENRRALKLILNKLKDLSKAVAFCQAQNDRELWEDFVKFALENETSLNVVIEASDAAEAGISGIDILKRIEKPLALEKICDSLLALFARREKVKRIVSNGLRLSSWEAEIYTAQLRQGRQRAVRFNNKNLNSNGVTVKFLSGESTSEEDLLGDQASKIIRPANGIYSTGQKITHAAYIREMLKNRDAVVSDIS